MKVLKRISLLTIVLLAALFASFTVAGNIAHAEEPPTISDHVYDPGDKLGGQADKVKERLASLDRSGLHVYVAFPSEYSNDTVSNWNLMALQKSGAPQGSYMLSIVADNPNQTMYLASADNAAKLSQEELSAIASEKMVPLLNQQKYPEAVLAYLDALSVNAPEMGSGLGVAPWAMIAFLIALIVVIIVISRVLRARRKAQDRTEDNTSGKSGKALASQDSRSQEPYSAVGNLQGGASDSPESASKQSSKVAAAYEDDHQDEQPSKGKFRLRFGRKDKSSAKSKSKQTKSGKAPAANPDIATAGSGNLAGNSSSQPEAAAALLRRPSTDAGLVNPESNLTSAAGTAQVKAEEANPAIPTGVPGTLDKQPGGKVPSLAELDQIALARTRSQATTNTEANAGYQVPRSPQAQAPTSSQLPKQSEEPRLPQAPAPVPTLPVEQPAISPQAAPETQPRAFVPESTGLPAKAPGRVSATAPRSNATYTPLRASSPLATATATSSAPQRHSSVLRPGETTYLPPQANDDDTQVTSAAQIKDYGQERRDEIARAKARAQAADRFREEQARKQALDTGQTAQTAQTAHAAQPQISPLPANLSDQGQGQAAPPFASPLPPQAVASPVAPAALQNPVPNNGDISRPQVDSQAATRSAYAPAVTSRTFDDFSTQAPDNAASSAPQRGQSGMPTLPKMAPAVNHLTARSLPPVSPQAIPQVSRQTPGQVSQQVPGQAPAMANRPASSALSPAPSQMAAQPVRVAKQSVNPSPAPQETAHREEARPAPDFTKVLRQADSWARKGASKLTLAQQRVGKTVTQPFALALVRAQDSVRAAFGEFATAQLQSRPINQQIVAGNLPGPLRELRDQITHFTNLYHQQTPLNEILLRFEREIVTCREDLVRCRLIVERIQNVDPQKATRIGNDVMGAHKLLSRAQNLIEDAKARDRAGQENEVLKATVRTENLLLQAQKIARQAHAEEAALRAAAKVEAALTFAEKVEPLSEQVAILMAAVDDYIGVHTAKVGVAARTMLDLANRTLTRLDQPGNHDPQEALRLLQRAQQQTEQALRLAENDVAKRS